nr:50S ribosomal protein L18 [Luteithermobacter gelatinilyticus]
MVVMLTSQDLFKRRRQRVRTQIRKVAAGRPRLSVHRTNQHIYAQVIDDEKGVTVAAASTLDADLRSKLKVGSNTQAAAEVGKLIADRAKSAGVTEVVFDRGGFLYHGRVKALAEAAREAGLNF